MPHNSKSDLSSPLQSEGNDITPEPDSPVSSEPHDSQDDDSIIWQFSNDITVENTITYQPWADILDDDFQKDASLLVDFFAGILESDSFDISCQWTDDAMMRRLNHEFRGQDKPTNVLSFPDGFDGHIGDLAFGYQIMKQQADEVNISVGHHARHLFIHGLLHLAGYDHHENDEAEDMEALEIAALSLVGVANPYQGELA